MADQTLVAITGATRADVLLLFLCSPQSAAWFTRWPEFTLVAHDRGDLGSMAPVSAGDPPVVRALNPPRLVRRKRQPWGT